MSSNNSEETAQGYERAQKILRFLLAIDDQDIAATLVGHGFTSADLEEGWQRLRALGRASVDGVVIPRTNEVEQAIAELETWAREWLPILKAVLTNRFPELAVKVGVAEVATKTDAKTKRQTNIAKPRKQATGSTERFQFLAFELPHIARRALALAKGNTQAKAASELLVRRGLTEEVLRVPGHLAKRAEASPDIVEPKPRTVSRAAAEREAWAWFQEWSAIARARINDGRLLRRLGFGKRGRPAGSKKHAAD